MSSLYFIALVLLSHQMHPSFEHPEPRRSLTEMYLATFIRDYSVEHCIKAAIHGVRVSVTSIEMQNWTRQDHSTGSKPVSLQSAKVMRSIIQPLPQS
ncbi:hypothetical protein BD289DRAFT_69242 [Coniella lustricola]|uniref:Secreted protein n=1 Tax=Coniella lustricola TaxID=2025994 RepID=A0A2T3A004_9PEZI|nr:hypothetical protein BD289DRAFT_69242 [Coniella lustricola]